MPEKLRERVKFYTKFEEVDVIETKHLPKECGGNVPIKEMIGNEDTLKKFFVQSSLIALSEPWKKLLASKRDFFLNYSNMKVNHKLYPAPVLNCVVDTLKVPLSSKDLFERTSNCVDEEMMGVQGSFRKLEID